MSSHYFSVADLGICIRFAHSKVNSMALLPSLAPFAAEAHGQFLLTLTIDDSLLPAEGRKLVRKFDTGNGDTLVYTLPDGGYQYIIRNTAGADCCLLVCNKMFTDCRCALAGDELMRSFGLNNALMMAFAFAASYHQTVLMHASTVMVTATQTAYPFTASSGTGKSTHVSLWLKHIAGCELLNDDNPVVRIVDGKPTIYGSPWSGKTPCYRNRRARLGAVTQIERALRNSIERLKPIEAFAVLLPACSTMKWDIDIYHNLCDTLTRIIETTPIYTLHCLPDEEAARLCHNTLTT